MSRREHNTQQLKAFLNKHYPESFQGRHDPELVFDNTKPGSSVLLKKGALERVDAQFARDNPNKPDEMKVKDASGKEPNPARSESYRICLHLLTDSAARISPLHQMASRLVLLNPNQAGGWVKMEALEQHKDKAQREIGALCRTVVENVLDELDRFRGPEIRRSPEGERETFTGYWLDIGTDETYRSKRHEWEVKRTRERENEAHEAYRKIYPKWREFREASFARDMSEMDAKEAFRKEYERIEKRELSPAKLYRAIRFCEGKSREESGREGGIGFWRDFGAPPDNGNGGEAA